MTIVAHDVTMVSVLYADSFLPKYQKIFAYIDEKS